MGTEDTGGAQHASVLADRLALLIVCLIFAHLRPVFYAGFAKHGLSRNLSDALAKQV